MIVAFQSVWRFWPALLGITAGILLLAGIGCTTPAPAPMPTRDAGVAPPDYAATVNALAPSRVLPTLTPTPSPLPPTDTPQPTPTATATLAPTPTPTPSPQPTYTPRLRPTYTPRPLPNQNQGGGVMAAERSPGIFFETILLDGSRFSMEETLGTPTLLAFWAPW